MIFETASKMADRYRGARVGSSELADVHAWRQYQPRVIDHLVDVG